MTTGEYTWIPKVQSTMMEVGVLWEHRRGKPETHDEACMGECRVGFEESVPQVGYLLSALCV